MILDISLAKDEHTMSKRSSFVHERIWRHTSGNALVVNEKLNPIDNIRMIIRCTRQGWVIEFIIISRRIDKIYWLRENVLSNGFFRRLSLPYRFLPILNRMRVFVIDFESNTRILRRNFTIFSNRSCRHGTSLPIYYKRDRMLMVEDRASRLRQFWRSDLTGRFEWDGHANVSRNDLFMIENFPQ